MNVAKEKKMFNMVRDYRVRSFMGLLIILIFAGIFASYLNINNGIESESKKLLFSIEVKNSGFGFVINDEVNPIKLSEIINKDYQSIKNEAGIKSDFCIFFEDQQGNILNLEGEFAKSGDRVCIGKDVKNI